MHDVDSMGETELALAGHISMHTDFKRTGGGGGGGG